MGHRYRKWCPRISTSATHAVIDPTFRQQVINSTRKNGIQTRNTMHRRSKAMQTGKNGRPTANLHNPAQIASSFPTGCAKNAKNTIAKSLHFHVWHFAMLPLGGVAKNYNISAQLHFLPYAKTLKVSFKLCVVYWFWCAQNYRFRSIFSTTNKDLMRWCVRMQKAIRKILI